MLQGGYISCHSISFHISLIALGLGKANSQDDGLAVQCYTEITAFEALSKMFLTKKFFFLFQLVFG